ncbi:lipoprotein insertase outer membrane protein LolB [Shewanella maritima]|uniref:lipoprotein insertase outer membrane protein LolB n=1 Tax=Shewanella maritima TaxID=2520507 RepID=UPI003735F375
MMNNKSSLNASAILTVSHLKRTITHAILVICTALIVQGCAIAPAPNFSAIDVTSVEQAKAWELQGKIAVRSATDKFSTNLYWFHQPLGDDLRLTTFIGTTLLTLKSNQQGAILEADGKTYQNDNAQALLDSMLQISIPLDSLPLWITGQANITDEIVSYNADGTIEALVSNDVNGTWQVAFTRWQQQSGTQVPRLITVKRNDVSIRIQTNQWQAMQADEK